MKHEVRQDIHIEKQLWWAHRLGYGGEVSGDLQGGANSISQVDGVPDIASACQLYGSVALWWEGLEKRQWPLLTFMPDSSLSPSMPLVPFKLLPQCWNSEGVSLSR